MNGLHPILSGRWHGDQEPEHHRSFSTPQLLPQIRWSFNIWENVSKLNCTKRRYRLLETKNKTSSPKLSVFQPMISRFKLRPKLRSESLRRGTIVANTVASWFQFVEIWNWNLWVFPINCLGMSGFSVFNLGGFVLTCIESTWWNQSSKLCITAKVFRTYTTYIGFYLHMTYYKYLLSHV